MKTNRLEMIRSRFAARKLATLGALALASVAQVKSAPERTRETVESETPDRDAMRRIDRLARDAARTIGDAELDAVSRLELEAETLPLGYAGAEASFLLSNSERAQLAREWTRKAKVSPTETVDPADMLPPDFIPEPVPEYVPIMPTDKQIYGVEFWQEVFATRESLEFMTRAKSAPLALPPAPVVLLLMA